MSWVKLAEVADVREAALLRARLEAEGIRVRADHQHLNALFPHLAWARVQLWVEEADYARARAIWDAWQRESV